MTSRKNSDSLCVQPVDVTRVVHRYVGVRGDLPAEMTASLTEVYGNVLAEAEAMGTILATLRLCATGELLTGDDDTDVLEPSRTQPEVWELKWHKMGRKRKDEVRLYHAESQGVIGILALRLQVKPGKQAQVTADQQTAEMAEATFRLTGDADRAAAWGHVRDDCHLCIV